MNTHNLLPQNRELLSALADSELLRDEFTTLLQVCEQDPKATESWNTYHVIGEVLRSPGGTAQLTDFVFMARLNQQLAKEPAVETGPWVLVPQSGADSSCASPVVAGGHRAPAANDGSFRWKLVAGFACAAAVSAIAWNVNGLTVPPAGPQLAQIRPLAEGAATQQVVVASPQGLVVRDARLEELLAAHKQLGATPALPVPSGFLRNATFETQQSLGR